MADIPDALKGIKQVLLRANEMDRAKFKQADLIAYCCRRYAFKKAYGDPSLAEEEGVTPYLEKLIVSLEKENPKLKQKYGDLMKEESKQLEIVRNFGMNIFKKASDTYKSGKATKSTAVSFFASSIYLEVAGKDDAELSQLRKVAKFKALEINKAIKEGRPPVPDDFEPEAPEEEAADQPQSQHENESDDPFGLPPAPIGLNLPPLEEDSESDKESEVSGDFRGFNPDLPPGAYARNITTFEDVTPRFGDLPANAGLSVRGMELLQKGRLSNQGHFGANRDKQAEDSMRLCRESVAKLKANDFPAAVDLAAEALGILERSKPRAHVAQGGLGATAQADAVEYLLFAARTLECAGELMPVNDAKKRAAALISNALMVAARG